MAVINSPSMNLPIPGVGTQSGPTYAENIDDCLTLVDQHDHSIGKGVQITPAGININAALSMGGNNLTNIASLVLVSQSAVSTLRALYVAPGSEVPTTDDLWFNDGNGNAIQITSGGTVNASIASLPGENYSAGTFFWKQGAGSTTPANFDIGSITIRPNTAGTTNGVQLNPPSGIASQYGLQLPLLPATTKFLQLDASGNLTGAIDITGGLTTSNISSTAGILGSQLSSTAGIVNGQIQNGTLVGSGTGTSKFVANTIGDADIASQGVSFQRLDQGAGNSALNPSTIALTTGTVISIGNINTGGAPTSIQSYRPIFVNFGADGGTGSINLPVSNNTCSVTFAVKIGGVTIHTVTCAHTSATTSSISIPLSALNCYVLTSPASGAAVTAALTCTVNAGSPTITSIFMQAFQI